MRCATTPRWSSSRAGSGDAKYGGKPDAESAAESVSATDRRRKKASHRRVHKYGHADGHEYGHEYGTKAESGTSRPISQDEVERCPHDLRQSKWQGVLDP